MRPAPNFIWESLSFLVTEPICLEAVIIAVVWLISQLLDDGWLMWWSRNKKNEKIDKVEIDEKTYEGWLFSFSIGLCYPREFAVIMLL